MKKGILCILLAIVMIVPLFTACQSESDLSGSEVSIYTLYTIKDEKTTEKAVREVELALNRILFYRLGVILDLVMVNEDEYEELIDKKFDDMAEYEAYKKEQSKNNKNNKNNKTSSEETSKDVMDGDKILDLLADGKDIPLENPRLDIFLVRGYDNYYELATTNKLAALDEKLDNEAKALKSYIHSTIFNAATVNDKVYGVPVNAPIGEYTYFIYDTELLEKFEIDPKTISSLEDLQSYLEIVKTNESDVIPLKNAVVSPDMNFLGEEGFPLIANDKEVSNTYENAAIIDYYSMIARYKALGYIGDEVAEGETDNNRYAVRIETGNKDIIEQNLPESSKGYTFSTFSAPLATNETAIDNIFCVSKYVVSNELTDVMEIVTALNTDADLMNLLTYGVEKTHYDLNDNNQVERLETVDPYIMNPNYCGNCFITYTLDGENPKKWDNYSQQNQEAIPSPALGFTQSLTKFEYKDEEDKEVTIYEPNYADIISSVLNKYYPALISGTAISEENFYENTVAQVTAEVEAEITEKLNDHYAENVLKPMYVSELRESITNKYGPSIRAELEDTYYKSYREDATISAKNELTNKFKNENPDADDATIESMVEEALTEELIDEKFKLLEDAMNEKIEAYYDAKLEIQISAAVEEVVGSPAYEKRLQQIIASDEYKQVLSDKLAYDAPFTIQNRVDDIIGDKLKEYTNTMMEELNTELGNAIEAFIEENKDALGLTREKMLETMGYMGVKEDEETEGETSEAPETSEGEGEGDEEEPEAEVLFDTWSEFVLTVKFQKPYKILHPDDVA